MIIEGGPGFGNPGLMLNNVSPSSMFVYASSVQFSTYIQRNTAYNNNTYKIITYYDNSRILLAPSKSLFERCVYRLPQHTVQLFGEKNLYPNCIGGEGQIEPSEAKFSVPEFSYDKYIKIQYKFFKNSFMTNEQGKTET